MYSIKRTKVAGMMNKGLIDVFGNYSNEILLIHILPERDYSLCTLINY